MQKNRIATIQKDIIIKIKGPPPNPKHFFDHPPLKKHSFSATLNDLCSLAVTAKKNTMCHNYSTQSLVLLLLTAAYLSKKSKKKSYSNVCSCLAKELTVSFSLQHYYNSMSTTTTKKTKKWWIMYHYYHYYYCPIHKTLMKNCKNEKKNEEENTFTAIMCSRGFARA